MKTFIFSIVCSLLVNPLIIRDAVHNDFFISIFLNSSSLILFLFLEYRSWAKVYDESSSAKSYFVPTFTSLGVYIVISATMYLLTNIGVLNVVIFDSHLFSWIFRAARFFEPIMVASQNFSLAFISLVLTYALMAGLIFATPLFFTHRK